MAQSGKGGWGESRGLHIALLVAGVFLVLLGGVSLLLNGGSWDGWRRLAAGAFTLAVAGRFFQRRGWQDRKPEEPNEFRL